MYLFMYTFSNKKSNSTALKLHKKLKIGEIIALEKKITGTFEQGCQFSYNSKSLFANSAKKPLQIYYWMVERLKLGQTCSLICGLIARVTFDLKWNYNILLQSFLLTFSLYKCLFLFKNFTGRIKALLLRCFFDCSGNWCGELRPPQCGTLLAAKEERRNRNNIPYHA